MRSDAPAAAHEAQTAHPVLRKDEWLSGLLGKDAYHLSVPSVARDHLWVGDALRALPAGPVFVDAKVPTPATDVSPQLEQAGFRIVDTNVQLARLAPFDEWSTPGDGVRFAVTTDEQAVASLSGRNLITSRFHLDPQIPMECARAVKEAWARNFFRGTRGDWMVVAEHRGLLAGFLQLLKSNSDLVIDLIAVDETARRLGLASAMIAFAAGSCGSLKRVVVGTQVSNASSLHFYEGLGFRVSASDYVFHYHSA